jgi:hypothetical protein
MCCRASVRQLLALFLRHGMPPEGCLLMRCYGGSDGENRIDRQIINRAMAPSPISTQPDGAIDAQAKKAA